MKRLLSVAACLMGLSLMASGAIIGADNSGNYSGGWTNESNGGTGFGAWSLTSGGGTGGFGGAELLDPSTSGGISGMGTSAFSLYADPAGSGAYANADRSFANPLNIGDTFSLLLGFNWDSDGAGNKGLNLYAGTTEIININMGGSSNITINGSAMFWHYGSEAMPISFQYQDATTLRVFATGRDGVETYDSTFTVDGAPTSFRVYASDLAGGSERKPYFDDLSITSIPEPVSAALLGLGVGFVYLLRRKVRK